MNKSDSIFFIGAGILIVCVGLFMISKPLGIIFFGLGLIGIGIKIHSDKGY